MKKLDIDNLIGNPTIATCINLHRLDCLGRFLTLEKKYPIIDLLFYKQGNISRVKIKSDTNRKHWFSVTHFKLT